MLTIHIICFFSCLQPGLTVDKIFYFFFLWLYVWQSGKTCRKLLQLNFVQEWSQTAQNDEKLSPWQGFSQTSLQSKGLVHLRPAGIAPDPYFAFSEPTRWLISFHMLVGPVTRLLPVDTTLDLAPCGVLVPKSIQSTLSTGVSWGVITITLCLISPLRSVQQSRPYWEY